MTDSDDLEHSAQPLDVELLIDLLARRTAPGYGHVIFSASEFEEWLREEFEQVPSSDEVETALRDLRNRLVHDHVKTTDYEILLTLRLTQRESLRAAFDESRKEVARGRSKPVSPSVATLTSSFVDYLTGHVNVLRKLHPDEAADIGRQAAEQAVAAARWSQVVGDRLDTSQVTALLSVSRQALSKRQKAGSLLGLPGNGTTWYPAWQFDVEAGTLRPEVRDIIGAFRDRLDDVSPFIIASWATTPQEEDLAGYTPAHWLRTGRGTEQLRTAAARAAARLAR